MNDPLITADEVATLNAARTILEAVEKRANTFDTPREPWQYHSCGRLAEAADTAESVIFGVLNYANASKLAPLTDDELHNREPAPVA